MGERQDVSHFARSDDHLAILAGEHYFSIASYVILLDADGIPCSVRDFKHNLRITHQVAVLLTVVGHGERLQFQWVCTVTAGKDADSRIPVSRGLRGACVIFRQDTPCKEQGQGTNGGPKRGADLTDNHEIAYRQ